MIDHADYDSPWKAMIERFFQEFMTFFFPAIAADIDWQADYEFLDKELQQVVREAEVGRRVVDKLVKVARQHALPDLWIFIHIEIQGAYEDAFEKRMYVYNYRLFDRYDHPICSVAVLTDERQGWKPTRFQYDEYGCQVSLTFPVIKLIEYRASEAELAASANPFALIVFAYLKTLETKKEPEQRLEWKIRLFRQLYKHGFSKADIVELMRFLDWVMVLPDDLAQRFDTTMDAEEEERKMEYITSFERIGMQKGLQQGIQQGLQQGLQQGVEKGQIKQGQIALIDVLNVRFATIPTPIITTLLDCDNLTRLQELLRQAITVPSLEEFEALLRQMPAPRDAENR